MGFKFGRWLDLAFYQLRSLPPKLPPMVEWLAAGPRALDVRFAPIDLERDFEACALSVRDVRRELRKRRRVRGHGRRARLPRGPARAVAEFPDGYVHVWQGGEIAGQLEMLPRPELGFGMVNLVYLVPACRGGPLSDALHDYIEATLRRYGMPKARLSVSPTNQRAIRYYLKHGWRDLGPRPDRPYVHAFELDLGTP